MCFSAINCETEFGRSWHLSNKYHFVETDEVCLIQYFISTLILKQLVIHLQISFTHPHLISVEDTDLFIYMLICLFFLAIIKHFKWSPD